MFADLPSSATYVHAGIRDGFEVVFFRASGRGLVLEGGTSAVEDGIPWSVQYRIEVDQAWHTTRVESADGLRVERLEQTYLCTERTQYPGIGRRHS